MFMNVTIEVRSPYVYQTSFFPVTVDASNIINSVFITYHLLYDADNSVSTWSEVIKYVTVLLDSSVDSTRTRDVR